MNRNLVLTSESGSSDKEEGTLNFAKDLLERCRKLADEIKQLQSFLVSQQRENIVDIRVFQNHVNAELKSLGKVRVAVFRFHQAFLTYSVF